MRGPRRKPRFDLASFGLIFAVYWLWRHSIVCCRIARLAIVVRRYRVARLTARSYRGVLHFLSLSRLSCLILWFHLAGSLFMIPLDFDALTAFVVGAVQG